MKKTICIILSIFFVIMLCACNNNTSESTSNPSEASKKIHKSTTTEDKTQEYVDRAYKMAKEGNYTEAFASLDTAEQLYGKSAKIDAAQYDIQKKQLLESVNEFMDSKNYGDAIKEVDKSSSSIKSDKTIIEKYNLCVRKYREQVISNAETAFKEKGYSEAISVLNEGLKILPDDSEFKNKLAEYKEYEPVSVSKLKVMGRNASDYEPTEYSDPRGNVVSNAIPVGAEYYLGGKYSTFYCTLDPVEDFPTRREYGEAIFKVYADEKLVYTSDKITYKTDDYKVKVKINNAQYIKLETVDVSKYQVTSSADAFMYNAYVSK